MKYITFVAILLLIFVGGIYGVVIKEEPSNQGIFMYYAIGKDDQTLFNKFYKQLKSFFRK